MTDHDRDVRRYLSSHRIAKEPMLMAVSVQNKCTSNTKRRFIIYDCKPLIFMLDCRLRTV